MKNTKVMDLINRQINHEMYSAYLYLDFSAFMHEQGLLGFASWYAVQAREEVDHALLFFNYMKEENAKIDLSEIKEPVIKDESVKGILKQGLEHEQFVTSLIHRIYDTAQGEKDFRTLRFLDWFIREQAEEESNANDLLTSYSFVDDFPPGLYLLDRELMKREYCPPDFLKSDSAA